MVALHPDIWLLFPGKAVSLGLNSDSRTQGFGGHFYMYFLKKRKYNKSKGEEKEMKTVYE
jgi:hypothetical protein